MMKFVKPMTSLLLAASFCTFACGNEEGNSGTDTVPEGSTDEYSPECTAFVDGEVEKSGDGWSWSSAMKTVQEGIDLAHYGAAEEGICEQWAVWVKQGTYYIFQDSREDTALLKENVALLGGFDGTETAEFDRDWETKVTTLDGRDGPNGENHVYHVVTGSNNATLDGFTITGGRADDDQQGSVHGWGGGMSIYYTSPTVSHCVFDDNSAIWSGGMDIAFGSPIVSECTFSNNSAIDASGAVSIVDVDSVTLTDIEFLDNSAFTANSKGGGVTIIRANATLERCKFRDNIAGLGGGLEVELSDISLDDCEFVGNISFSSGGGARFVTSTAEINNTMFDTNTADWGGGMSCVASCSIDVAITAFSNNISYNTGGAIYVEEASATVSNSTFEDNWAQGGGGMYIVADSTATLSECTFEINTAAWGGGIASAEGATTTVSKSIFDANTAEVSGGGIENDGSNTKCTNCVFTGNSASKGPGGGIFSRAATTTATNCTFYDNTAMYGAALYSTTSSPEDGEVEDDSTIVNSIAWNNSPVEIEWDGTAPIVTYSDIEGGFKGEGNIDLDPRFVDAVNGDFHLQSDSPCIGTASAEAAPETDFDGNPRDDEPDMGAFEVQ